MKRSFWRWPIMRHLRAMQFRRLQPLNKGRLNDRTLVVRYYWDQFLTQHQGDIRGRGLEIGETCTLRRYGGQALTLAEAIDMSAHSPEVTIVADLSRADHAPADTYDCFINQFSMPVIYDVEAALYHSMRILKPGGVLLVNFACVDYYLYRGLDMGTGAPLYMYWMFTPLQIVNMLNRLGLTEADYHLQVYGNLLTRIAFLLNLPAEELTRQELTFNDPGQPLLICVRAVKPQNWQTVKPTYQNPCCLPQSPPARANPVTGHYADAYT